MKVVNVIVCVVALLIKLDAQLVLYLYWHIEELKNYLKKLNHKIILII